MSQKDLEHQLNESRALREQLEQTYRAEMQTLTQFISRLGNALRGVDGELDHRLSRMQSALGRADKLERVMPIMDDVSVLLQQQGTRVQRQLQDTQTRLLAASKQLQQLQGLPTDMRGELRDLIAQIEGPAFSVLHYLPYLNQMLELYQRGLDVRVSRSDTTGILDQLKENGEQRYASLKEELINLLSVIDFSGNAATGLQSVRQQLIGGLSEEQFVMTCVQVVRLIVQGINEERQTAQLFLQHLNEVLGTVSNSVSRTISTSQKANKAQQSLDEKLQTGIQALSESTNSACTLKELTNQIKTHLEVINATIKQKQEIQSKSHKALTIELKSAQQRILELEEKAEVYKEKLSEQKFKSLQDSLTRLPNRAAFEERLELEYKRWQRYDTPLAMAIADIDNFKSINDTYGHIAGDKTLQVIANMLKKSLRGTDFVARYGGEEFVIIFPQSELSALAEPLEKARKRIQSIPFKFKNNDISITISIGAAGFHGDDTISSVFERADAALYSAKKSGRNRVVIESR
ncbi:MAG: diguanylate cyclase [Idiomarina sp.]|nr:diguanylate cyclase [Idiomarina sp.]